VGGRAILKLRTVRASDDYQYPGARHAPATQRDQPFLDFLRQRRFWDVDPQFDRRRISVIVEAPRHHGANKAFSDLAFVKSDRIGNVNHWRCVLLCHASVHPDWQKRA
jgi:hypothetical protein